MILRRPPAPRPSRRRGSVLIVALIFSLVIALSLASFLNISTNASRLSYRTFYQGAAMNIAESGLEQALWEMNRATGGWTGWEAVATNIYRKSFDMGGIEGGATSAVKVYAKTGSGAYVIARAIVTPPRGAPIEKWIRVTLSKSGRYAVGGLGRKGIVANGNQVEMASWNSDPDNNPNTLFVPFSEAVMNDNVPLATLDLDASLNSGQANVNGTAAVGGDSLDAIKVGTNGYIGPFGTAAGTKDPDSVSTNFSTDLETPRAPSATYTSIGAITGDTTLPRSSDLDTSNPNKTYYYSATQLSLTNNVLNITPGTNVVLVVDGVGGINVGGGSGAINVGGTLTTNTSTGAITYTSATLKIYTDGNVDIGGQGAANQVTTQTYTPESSTPVTTTTYNTLSEIKDIYGKGNQKNTIIGWSYKQTTTTSVSVNGGTPTVTTSSPTTYTLLLSNVPTATKPVAGSTVPVVTTTTSTSPAVTTTTGTLPGQPANFRIYGTRPDTDLAPGGRGTQTIKISGNGELSAVVDAPNGVIQAKGGGNSGFIYGSLIGYTLTFTGNDGFYYDESLANLDDSSKLGIDNWDELVTADDRSGKVSNVSSSTYASLMSF